ncbi:MAG TPA: hypothetical protein VHK27_05635 [Gammaproteobacteria bacterium]|nr:hypothetical protein [Gammaproteobacteria bacterium]
MKRKIKKADWEKLSDDLKALYEAKGDDYVLKLEDDEDPAPELRRALERTRVERDELRTQMEGLQARLEELEENKNKKKGDVDALETSYKNKLEEQKKKFEKMIEGLKAQLSRLLVDNVAQAIASEISTKPSLILPHIKASLQADLDGDEPVTRVLGKDGKPSATTLAELKQSFIDNEDFAPIIIGSKASGSGAGGNTKGSGGAKKPEEYTEQERTHLYRTNREEFYRLFPPTHAGA